MPRSPDACSSRSGQWTTTWRQSSASSTSRLGSPPHARQSGSASLRSRHRLVPIWASEPIRCRAHRPTLRSGPGWASDEGPKEGKMRRFMQVVLSINMALAAFIGFTGYVLHVGPEGGTGGAEPILGHALAAVYLGFVATLFLALRRFEREPAWLLIPVFFQFPLWID